MKKFAKVLSVLCLVAMMFALVACGGEEAPADNSNNSNVTVTAGSKYVFSYYGVSVPVDAEASGIVAAIGEPLSYFEAESCAFEGMDKTYTYVDLVIVTYPDGATDRISTIRLTADTVSTPEGIEIGNTLADMIAAYGEGYVQDVNSYTYTDGNTELMFIVDGDVINSITYSLAD